jgi:hypothetical protein
VFEGPVFGNFHLATASGFVVLRQEANGRMVARSDLGLAGQTAFIDRNNNQVLDAGEPRSITDERGYFELRGLPRGEHILRLQADEDLMLVEPAVGRHVVSDGGISGVVHRDLNFTMISLPVLAGTSGNDTYFFQPSNDLTTLEVYDRDPNTAGATPIFTWPMNATAPLPIELLTGDDTISLQFPPGTSGPVGGFRLDTGPGNNTLNISGGPVRIDAIASGGNLQINLLAGAQLVTSRFQRVGLDLDDGSKAALLPNGDTSLLTGLTVGTAATLDIANNSVAIDYTGPSPAASIRQKILAGRGNAGIGEGAWTGAGITSSTAAAANAIDPESRSVGYAENALLPLGPYTTFRGVPVDDTTLLIAFARTADANLDGLVDDADVTVLSAFYAPATPNPVWAFGDFDFNGFVDDGDATIIGAFYQPGLSGPPPANGGRSNAPARSSDTEAADDESLFDIIAHAVASELSSLNGESTTRRLGIKSAKS